MNTTQLKRFAAEARNKLREGVKGRLIRLGFDLKTGDVPENLRPVAVENAGVWRGKPVSQAFVSNWNDLYKYAKQIGIKQTVEEGAYTWFNRLVAIRILAKNNLCEPVLEYVDSARTPRIVEEARTGRIPSMSEEQRRHLDDLLDDDRLVTEQFAVLINAWVNNNPIISTCFDANSKHFMELLLPDDIRNEGGFLDMLNSADFIDNEDYKSPELIGWLYQFYISERKDEVFAKKGKYDADEIAPATQIFTPNWIVKYMVQNTVGRIYLDSLGSQASLPDIAKFKTKWKYLVEPSESETNNRQGCLFSQLEDLKVADLACGSGHILNECFDLLYELYIHEGYSRREAVTNIFEHNLTGIDIDLRAKQLATFALLLKACQRDSSFADAHCLPHVYDMPKVDRYTFRDTAGHFDCAYQIRLDNANNVHKELDAAFTLMEDADTLASIMKFEISPKTREYLIKAVDGFNREPKYASSFKSLIDGYKMILALTENYDAIVMNPPYMPCSKIDALNKYVIANYKEGKADLFAVFMQVCMDRLCKGGRMGMINMQSWMFLSSFESLRRLFLEKYQLSSMLHLGPRTFDELSGEVVQNTAFVFVKINPQEVTKGTYFRLVEGKNCTDKEALFHAKENLYSVRQLNFDKIPGRRLGYWASERLLKVFQERHLGEISDSREGMTTGSNEVFVRNWHEVSFIKIGLSHTRISAKDSGLKWFPYAKGGNFRNWYGNQDCVVNWQNDGNELMSFSDPKTGRIRSHNYNLDYIFKPCVSQTKIGKKNSYRYYPQGFLCDSGGGPTYSENLLKPILGFMISEPFRYILSMYNPTTNVQPGDKTEIPLVFPDSIIPIIDSCISISKIDWDAHETSWDFQANEIVDLNDTDKYIALMNGIYEGSNLMVDLAAPHFDSLQWRTEMFKAKWSNKFDRLQANEEELNRRFIEIYGLQDELKPDVPLNEVTILQQGEISIWKEGDPLPREAKNGNVEFSPIVWHDDVLMKQLISYAVGCMMGRYRLDRPGLAIAHPDATAEEIAPYPFNGEMFDIDDDAIIPLMPTDCGFYDNATQRMSDFVRQVFGADTQTENLNYIEKCLGKSIEQYFIKDFWKDHKKMYQNRPIYWLFSSKKGAFQVITYMHRMTPYTVERIRAKYLLPYVETLNTRISELQAREDELSTTERKRLDSLQKQLEECREYHDRLAVVAEQAIGFDLDDGVLHNYALYGDILTKLK